MSGVKIHYNKKNNIRVVIFRDIETDKITGVTIMDTPLVYCDNCKHGHLMEKSGATYCDWWQYRVDESGWCYKGESNKGE